MTVLAEDTFYAGLKRISDKTITDRVGSAIKKLESANNLRDVAGIKAMQGYTGYYRMRVGDWRIGFSLEVDDSIILLKIGPRGEFYKYFPKNYA